MMATDGILSAYYATERVICKQSRLNGRRREPPAASLFGHEEHLGVRVVLRDRPRCLDDPVDDDPAAPLVDRLDADERIAVGAVADDGAVVRAEQLREQVGRGTRGDMDDDGRMNHPP